MAWGLKTPGPQHQMWAQGLQQEGLRDHWQTDVGPGSSARRPAGPLADRCGPRVFSKKACTTTGRQMWAQGLQTLGDPQDLQLQSTDRAIQPDQRREDLGLGLRGAVFGLQRRAL